LSNWIKVQRQWRENDKASIVSDVVLLVSQSKGYLSSKLSVVTAT
jgi:hypothetical protein